MHEVLELSERREQRHVRESRAAGAVLAQKDRVQIIMVLKGSIVVHFWIKANRTADEVPAAIAMDNLKWQLTNPKSPIRRDEEFGRFAEWATVEEKHLSGAYHE